jgi:hypothetical protein
MNKLSLTESELKETMVKIYKEEQIKLLDEKWNKLSGSDRAFVLEMLKSLYPEKSHLIKESWYNTVGDIVGIFDPTGLVDLVNGISYWRQGDKLFAMLSWISVIPYMGDLIAKPVVGVIKAGGIVGKEFKTALAAGDVAKVASSAKKSSALKMFVQKSPEWGGKLLTMLKNFIGRFPIIRRIIPIVEDYIKLFKGASAEMKTVGTAGKEAETVFKGFRDFKGVKNNWFKYMKSDVPLWEKLNAGSFRIFGGNPATRSLMRRSKWYLGFLDIIGVANATGPEEVESKVDDFEAKLDEYNRSPEGKRNYQEDMSQQSSETTPPPPPPTSSTAQTSGGGGMDPVSALMSLFGGGGGGTGSKVIGALI